MNKTAIKNFAIWARKKLIVEITYKANLLGITDEGIKEPLPQSTNDVQFFDIGTKEPNSITGVEIEQRRKLAEAMQKKASQSDHMTAYNGVIEEVAYTWFNRLIAVRFMEVNEYLPSRIRVLSSASSSKTEPDMVTSPFDADMAYTPYEKDRIMQLKNENQLDELFRMLFIKQCNALHDILPELFEKTNDYTELLMNISFTDHDGPVYHLVNDISEDDFDVTKEGQVEIIGWLYQYYNTEPKSVVDSSVKNGGKVSKEDIPAKTQLFTPDWIVRYMIENSIGRLWIEGHPSSELKYEWKFLLEEDAQKVDVQTKLNEIKEKYKGLKPENIKFIDPCMGSGHVLVYSFDLLMQIYENAGYSQREAAKSILENNIYGLDIDDRAFQLSYFAVMMKGRQYNRRILSDEITCNVYSIQESNGINRMQLKYFGEELSDFEKNDALNQMNTLLDIFQDAKEYGSILSVENLDWELLNRFVTVTSAEVQISLESFGLEYTKERLLKLIKVGQILSQKYDVVVTNPPYMGNSMMSNKLSAHLKENYPKSKGDLFAVFIEVACKLAKKDSFFSLITMQSWMFLSSYEKLRRQLVGNDLITMLHLGSRAFEEINGDVVQTVAFVFRNSHTSGFVSICDRLITINNAREKEVEFYTGNYRYYSKKEAFEMIPGKPYAYWISEAVLKSFSGDNLGSLAEIVSGMTTGNNELYLREWFEVDINSIAFEKNDISDIDLSITKWIPYNKGGEQRKWYGNNEYVVNWSQSKNFNRAKTTMTHLYLKPCVTWSDISGNSFAGRYCSGGFMFDVKGSCGFGSEENILYLMAIFNSKITPVYVEALNPTTTTQVGDLKRIPLKKISAMEKNEVFLLVKENIKISKQEWDSFELSWDFEEHPFMKFKTTSNLLSEAFDAWKTHLLDSKERMQNNESQINQIVIERYGLADELTSEVDINNITMGDANLQRDVRSFIAYAVGCMFGRYSLDKKGVTIVGNGWNDEHCQLFRPDADNVLPINDEEYFEDDIVAQFCEWLKASFGVLNYARNLDFISSALGDKGNNSREVIRNYFLNDFYTDHCKIYKKHPIYWLFDSGKADGFKALVYMHRYNADTIGNLRIDYLHRMQRIYDSEIVRMQEAIANGENAREVAAATKRKEKLAKQLKETKEYDELIAHLALARIEIDLDDGVKVNYEKVQTGIDGKKLDVLAKI